MGEEFQGVNRLLIVRCVGLFSEDALAFLKMAAYAFEPKGVFRVVHIRLQRTEIRPDFKLILIKRLQMSPRRLHTFFHNFAQITLAHPRSASRNPGL